MEHTNFKSHFSRFLFPTLKGFGKRLYRYYRQEIRSPKKTVNDTVQLIKKIYSISMIPVKKEELEPVNREIMGFFLQNSSRIWRIANDQYADLFYRNFRKNYFFPDCEPDLCVVYNDRQDRFMSCCTPVEDLLQIERGVDITDKTALWGYLNDLYAYNEWLYQNGL